MRSACLGAGLATWEGKARKSKDRGVVVVRVMMTHSLPPEMRLCIRSAPSARFLTLL